MSNVPIVFEDKTVKSVKGKETGLDLNLLPPADNLALVVETSQNQHLPHQSQAWNDLSWVFVMIKYSVL